MNGEICQLDDGEIVTIKDSWDLEFMDERLDPRQFVAMQELDRALCESATLAKMEDGRFFVFWTERHPELGTVEDFYDHDTLEEMRRDPDENWNEWNELGKRLPSKEFYKAVDRAEAYRIVQYFWLPLEFLQDAGFQRPRPGRSSD